MTADEFRSLALSLPETEERAHMGHPDFRVGGKIFATLAYLDENLGMVKLTPDQQRLFIRTAPKQFRPVKGAWGRQGCTHVLLSAADEPTVRQALIAAWRNRAPKKMIEKYEHEL